MRRILALGTALLLFVLLAPAAASAAEPNNSFATATGPLTAGQTLKASLETVNDVDYQFFYIPDTVQLTVTTINDSKASGKPAKRGRTIVTSLLRARKGKLPLPLANTQRTLRPGKRAKVEINLVPGKYFVPVGHAETKAAPLANVPFRIQIAPVGATTDSFEVFHQRCQDAHRKLSRIKASKKRTARRLAKARHQHRHGEVRKLRRKLHAKRDKAGEAQRIKRIVCSVPR